MKAYSINDEEYRFTDLSSLFDEMNNQGILEVGAVYYEVETEEVSPASFLCADMILEQAGDYAYDNLGECAEEMFDVSNEAFKELEEALKAWAEKHVKGAWWQAKGTPVEHVVTADDLPQQMDE